MSSQEQDLHRIVSTAIIYKRNKYLITKRSLSKKVFPGLWTVPGGGLAFSDYMNTPKSTSACWYFPMEKSLRREIQEEVNLEIGDLQYLLDLTFVRPDKIPVITLSFYSPYKSGKIKLDEDSTDYKWIAANEVYNYELIEGIAEEILIADKLLNGERIPNRLVLFDKLLNLQGK